LVKANSLFWDQKILKRNVGCLSYWRSHRVSSAQVSPV
jgi:hypothetical protein